MKKVLLVNKYYHPDIGGVETIVKQHAEMLKDEHDVTVLCVHKRKSAKTKKLSINGVHVIRCSSFGTFFSMPLSISFFYYYCKLYIQNEVIINHAPFPLADIAYSLISYIKKRKLYIFWHSDIVKQKIFKKILSPFTTRTCNQAFRILTTSEALAKNSKDLVKYQHKVEVVPLSVDCISISKYSSNNITQKRWDFIFFGRLCYYKGVEVLIDAIHILKDKGVEPKIIIAGDGELKNYIVENITTKKLKKVHFVSRFLTEEEKYEFLSSSKCFLFPSVANSEAFGITQLEAMALSVPVINTNLPTGVPSVSKHNETGLTVQPGSSKELAEAMLFMMNNPSQLSQFSEKCFPRVITSFDDKIIKNKLMSFIE